MKKHTCPNCGHLFEKDSGEDAKTLEEIRRITKREIRRNYIIEGISESSEEEEIVEKPRPSPSIKKKKFLEENPSMEGAYYSSSDEDAINLQISDAVTGPFRYTRSLKSYLTFFGARQ